MTRDGSRLVFHLDTVEWYRNVEPVPHLSAVAAAVWEEKQLAIRYESWKGVASRTVHPLGLVLKAGVWYLVGAVDGKPRTYRISSIQEVRTQDARAVRPAKFDLARYWAESLERFETQLYKGRATVLATANGIAELKKLSAAVAAAVASSAPASRRDGRRRLAIPIEAVEHAARQLLPLAPDVEVLEPRALKRAIAQKLRDIARCYRVALKS